MYLKSGIHLQQGKYRIVRFLASGGFGCTYEAEHLLLGKKVAIKEFFPKTFCNRESDTVNVTVGTTSQKPLVEKLKKKFIEEARSIAKLSHNGIVKVVDVFEENGTAYYVMDFIEGRSLDKIIATKGPLSEKEALHYIREVSDALSYVHNKNILHLDIKPGNIMINENNHAILIDFGASKQYDEENGENTSSLLGKTPGYAPLEQMGNDVSRFKPATDIYALGATLYKCLSGKTPLEANVLADGEELEPLPSRVSVSTKRAVNAAMDLVSKKRPQTVEKFTSILFQESGEERAQQQEQGFICSNNDQSKSKLQDNERTIINVNGRNTTKITDKITVNVEQELNQHKNKRYLCVFVVALLALSAFRHILSFILYLVNRVSFEQISLSFFCVIVEIVFSIWIFKKEVFRKPSNGKFGLGIYILGNILNCVCYICFFYNFYSQGINDLNSLISILLIGGLSLFYWSTKLSMSLKIFLTIVLILNTYAFEIYFGIQQKNIVEIGYFQIQVFELFGSIIFTLFLIIGSVMAYKFYHEDGK